MVARLSCIALVSPRRATVAATLAALLLVSTAVAGPLVGFVEHWPGTSLAGWTGGASYSNPGTGGVGGAGDGCLVVTRSFVGNLGTFSPGPEYSGDWIAAGVVEVHVWLKDVNAAEPLEIHFSIGNDFNFWQYNVGFVPPQNAWQEFVVDLSSSANWTRIIGSEAFPATLQSVSRIHLRHDKPPFYQSPDVIRGDFAVDRLLLTNPAVPVSAHSWGRLKALYR